MKSFFHRINNIFSKDGLYWICWYIIKATKIDRFVSDSAYIKIQYRCATGKKLNLKNPKSFNEKLQWLKLYNHNPIYTQMVDKYEAKKFVANIIGEQYIIPTLGVWEKTEDIEWDKLPSQFVLKCTHNSGGIVICRDKEKLNKEAAIKKLNKSLKNNYYKVGREWPYKNVHRRIIAEKYMVDESGEELKDYKFFCFDGNPRFIQVDYDRFNNHKRNLYDVEWNRLPFTLQVPTDWKHEIPKPEAYSEMLEISKKLSKGISHLRVDLYHISGKVYFGEMTFFHGCGHEKFKPEEWNYKFGEWIKLPIF